MHAPHLHLHMVALQRVLGILAASHTMQRRLLPYSVVFRRTLRRLVISYADFARHRLICLGFGLSVTPD